MTNHGRGGRSFSTWRTLGIRKALFVLLLLGLLGLLLGLTRQSHYQLQVSNAAWHPLMYRNINDEFSLELEEALYGMETEVAIPPRKKYPGTVDVVLPNGSHSKNTPDPELRLSQYITAQFPGRLGNFMFVYASLLGIAHASGLIPCVEKVSPLRDLFAISVAVCPEDLTWAEFHEHKACAYDERTQRLNYTLNVELVGYYQSWRYFPHREELKREFKMSTDIVVKAVSFLQRSLVKFFGSDVRRQDVVVVGVHVRRGDMLTEYNHERGYAVPGRHSISAAVSYFEALYGDGRMLFVIVTDDVDWVIQNIASQKAPIVISEFLADDNDGGMLGTMEDMSLLCMSNHTVMTVGTFGWWGAWLAGGRTTYYPHFPSAGSPVSVEFVKEDFFPTDWVGIG